MRVDSEEVSRYHILKAFVMRLGGSQKKSLGRKIA